MTATEELRRMLAESGVEWWPEKYYKDECTIWHANGMEWRASEQTDGKLLIGCTSLAHLTPEQAIAATLGDTDATRERQSGAKTCEADETETIACRCYGDPRGKAVYHIHVMECTECGHTYEHVNGDYEYCPRCGRKRRDFVE